MKYLIPFWPISVLKGYMFYYITPTFIAFDPLFVFKSVLIHRNYASFRARWPVKVNCWFCNENTKVWRQHLNWWLCPWCEQYNGFSKVNYREFSNEKLLCHFDTEAILSLFDIQSETKTEWLQVAKPNDAFNINKISLKCHLHFFFFSLQQ